MKSFWFFLFSISILSSQNIRLLSSEVNNYTFDLDSKQKRMTGINIIPVDHPDSLIRNTLSTISDTLNKIFGQENFYEISDKTIDGIEYVQVYSGNTNINLFLLLKGYATRFEQFENSSIELFTRAENYDRYHKLGVWAVIQEDSINNVDSLFFAKSIDTILKENQGREIKISRQQIARIVDNNLFVTTTGEIIKLNNLDVPGIVHSDKRIRDYALEIYAEIEANLLNKVVDVECIKSTNDFYRVNILKETNSDTIDYIKLFLRNGWGKIKDRSDSLFNRKYSYYENEAEIMGKGIWKNNLLSRQVLDPELSNAQIEKAKEYYKNDIQNQFADQQRVSTMGKGSQFLMDTMWGTLSGIGGFTLGAYLITRPGGSASGEGALGNLFLGYLGGRITSIFTSSWAISASTRKTNPGINYWELVLTNCIGILGDVLLAQVSYTNHVSPLIALGGGLTLSSLISATYANYIYKPDISELYKKFNPSLSKEKDPLKKSFVEIPLLRVNL